MDATPMLGSIYVAQNLAHTAATLRKLNHPQSLYSVPTAVWPLLPISHRAYG